MTIQHTLQAPGKEDVTFENLVTGHSRTLLIFVRHLG
ncbi:hypothetical protein Bsel_0918 [[Bacillus] selenitireducens MLS10]|uniref:Uncharacterized protein n=1 Tax=Bacillus selenitireducens (strain ATCC 700615 / DSM 15326 / MLS10) TaxID=439292 RepID=D6Y050_BACIE|nr:hypothetical protein Bsel_0918 [[Bacillus] selenitireducens MLS10]